MTVFNLTTTPAVIDDGTSDFIAVVNTGGIAVSITRAGREVERLRAGARGVYYLEHEVPLSAATVSGLGTVSVVATAKAVKTRDLVLTPSALAAHSAFTGLYARRIEANGARTRSVWAVGDSHTAGAGTGGGGITFDALVHPSAQQGGLMFQGGSWIPWAMLSSGCRWTFRGLAATGGYTAAQILATHVPQIIAAATPGDTVVVHAGVNGSVLADVLAIHEALRTARLNTVAILVPPNTASTLAATLTLNEGIRAYAIARGIPLVDVHAAVADPTTGLWLSAYNGDGTHANQLGSQVIGQAIAAVLNGLFPTALSLINFNAAVAGQLQTKPLALATPSSPAEFTTLAGIGTGTIAGGAVAGMVGGNGYIFTYGDTAINARMGNWALVAGRRYRLGMALSAVASTNWGMRLESATTGQKILWGLGYTTALSTSQPLGRFYSEFTVPAGLPDYTYRLRIALGSGVLNLGEVTMLDLTALGG